jgi:phage FluMu protein Com
MLHLLRAPKCPRCHDAMHWQSEQFHGDRAVQVYCCERCDKLQAEAGGLSPPTQPATPLDSATSDHLC